MTLSWVFSLFLYLPVTIFHSVVALGIFKGFGLFKRKCIDGDVTNTRNRVEEEVQSCADKCCGMTVYTTRQLGQMLWWYEFEMGDDSNKDLPGGAGAGLCLGPSILAGFCLCPCLPIYLIHTDHDDSPSEFIKEHIFDDVITSGIIKSFSALNDMMVIVVSVFMVLVTVPAMILGTLTAFHVYQGHTVEENNEFVGALYGFAFGVFSSWSFALPAFSFDLLSLLTLDFGFVWRWRFVLPSGLLDVADGFTVLSFLGALVKIAVTLINGGIHAFLKAGLQGCLDAYNQAGGANVSLGDRAHGQVDDEFFLKSHSEEENVAWWQEKYGAESLVVEKDGRIKIDMDHKYADQFDLGLDVIAEAFPNLYSLKLHGLKKATGPPVCDGMRADTHTFTKDLTSGCGSSLTICLCVRG